MKREHIFTAEDKRRGMDGEEVLTALQELNVENLHGVRLKVELNWRGGIKRLTCIEEETSDAFPEE